MKWLVALIIFGFGAIPALADYEAAAHYSASLRGISMLVMVDGEVVFEDYPNDGAPDRAYALASGTKSFVGIMAAAAVQDGLLDLDELVSDTITEWEDGRRAEVTVRQLLHQTDGLALRGHTAGRMPTYEDTIRARSRAEPGAVFAYRPVPFQLFGEIMRRKLDGNPVDYLTRRIFEPIGLEVESWRRGRDGNPLLPTGAQLTARNWARLGEFVLARGRWNGEALVSPAAFEELFQGSEPNPAYGLTWWLNEPVDPAFASATAPLSDQTDFWRYPDDFPSDMVFAAGVGNQRLYISWERNMVVVRQAEGIMGALMGRRLSWSDTAFWRLLDAAPGETPEPVAAVVTEPAVPVVQQNPGSYQIPTEMVLPLPAEETPEDAAEPEEEDEFVGPTF